MYQINISEPARNDLSDALDYITKVLKAPVAAVNLIDDFEAKMGVLSRNPLSCAIVSDAEFAKRGLRYLLVKNYIAFFTVNDIHQTVNIVRFLYGRRDWLSLLIATFESSYK